MRKWVDKVANADAVQKVQEHMLNIAQQQKLKWIRHILRHESLLRDTIGKATSGIKRLQMLSDVTSMTHEDLKQGS